MLFGIVLCLLFVIRPSLWSPFLVLLMPITPICGIVVEFRVWLVVLLIVVVVVAVAVVDVAVVPTFPSDVEEEIVVGFVVAAIARILAGVPACVGAVTADAVAVAAAAIALSNGEGTAAVRCTTSTLDILSLFLFPWCVPRVL